jgi:hypothetical protein
MASSANKASKGFNLAQKYSSSLTDVISHLSNFTGSSHLLTALPQNLGISGYGSKSPIQNPEMFNSMIANLSHI